MDDGLEAESNKTGTLAVKKTKAYEEALKLKSLKDYDNQNILEMQGMCAEGRLLFWHKY